MTRIPYRTSDDQLPLQKGPLHDLGFVRTLKGKIAQLKQEVKGLTDRLTYKYADGVPASYVGEKVFIPEDNTITLDVLGEGNNPANVQPVNYVIRDADPQSVAVRLSAPGVFMARFLRVTFYQRYFDPTFQREMWFPIPVGKPFFNVDPTSADPTQVETLKWHLFYNIPNFNDLLRDRLMGMNFFWNMIDRDSGRKLSDEFVSHTALLPGGYQNQLDGNMLEFDVPWLFERAGVLEFQFRLLNPMLQLDPTSTVFPFAGRDDRENNGTTRNQSVKVRVELHGTKFYSERDTLLREAV